MGGGALNCAGGRWERGGAWCWGERRCWARGWRGPEGGDSLGVRVRARVRAFKAHHYFFTLGAAAVVLKKRYGVIVG